MKDTDQPLVSIGLPVLNGGATLRASLHLLLQQTWKNFELIISDNASDDDTARILDEFQDPRVRRYLQPSRLTAFDQFKFVRDQSKGEFFLWATADDLRSPEYLERCMALLLQHPEAVGVTGSVELIDTDGNFLSMDPVPKLKSASNPFWRLWILARYREDRVFYSLWRTKVLRKARISPWIGIKNRPNNSAFPLLAGVLAQGPLLYSPDCVLRFRVHERPHHRPLSLWEQAVVSANTVFFSGWEVYKQTSNVKLASVSLASFGIVQSVAFGRHVLRTAKQYLRTTDKH